MSLFEIERILKHSGVKEITNHTQLGTYAVVETNKFTTKGISNRDNARWKRAQYIIVDYCPTSYVQICLNGFLQFAEGNQFLIIANLNQVFNGNGSQIPLSSL